MYYRQTLQQIDKFYRRSTRYGKMMVTVLYQSPWSGSFRNEQTGSGMRDHLIKYVCQRRQTASSNDPI